MSNILGDFITNKPKPKDDGLVQTLPPENSIPERWTKNEHRIFTGKKKTGEITEWRNEKDELTHYTERSINKDGEKFILPFSYFVNGSGEGGFWQSKKWQGDKCFHKSHKISKAELPLMIVEGEKCMHFVEKNSFLSKHYLPTTWYGGVNNLDGFNFEIFRDKEVILFPDNDVPGRKAMHTIAYKLITEGITENIKYFVLPEKFQKEFKTGWDIADDFPDGYKLEDALDPGSIFLVKFANVKEDRLWKEIESDEQEKAEKEKAERIKKSYCYVMANDMFNKLGSTDFFIASQLNNFHKHEVQKGSLTDLLLKNPDFKKAETFITSAKHNPGIINITKPGIIPLINKGMVLNIYIPNYLTEKKGDIKFLIEFYIWLIGEKKWRTIEQWIAYLLQHPGEKIKWSIVLVSAVEGVGKGLLARILSRILGSDNVNENANYKHLANTHNTLLVGTQVLVLNEVSLGDFKSKAEGTNTLKNFVGDDIYSCNFKNKPMVKLPNLTNFMLFSNDERVLGVNQGARRYFFCNIKKTEEEIIKKTDEGFFDKAWNFVDSDEGASALIYYFNKEVKISDPTIFKKRAPQTDDLKELIEQSKHPVQKKLEADLKGLVKTPRIFDKSWSGLITFEQLNEKLNTSVKDDMEKFNWGSYSDDALFKFLSANCIPWNNGENTKRIEINGARVRVYLLQDKGKEKGETSYKDLTPKELAEIIAPVKKEHF